MYETSGHLLIPYRQKSQNTKQINTEMGCRQAGRQADRQTERASKTGKEDATCMTDSEKPFSKDHYEVSVLANTSW